MYTYIYSFQLQKTYVKNFKWYKSVFSPWLSKQNATL